MLLEVALIRAWGGAQFQFFMDDYFSEGSDLFSTVTASKCSAADTLGPGAST
jgi:hypothetical protein